MIFKGSIFDEYGGPLSRYEREGEREREIGTALAQ